MQHLDQESGDLDLSQNCMKKGNYTHNCELKEIVSKWEIAEVKPISVRMLYSCQQRAGNEEGRENAHTWKKRDAMMSCCG